MPTTMSGICTSGFWLTRSFDSAMAPRPISAMMMTMAAMGRFTEKSDRNMADSRSGAGGGRGGAGGRLLLRHALAVDQRGAGGAQQLVAGGDAAADHELAPARIALAEGDGHLVQRAARQAPDEGLVALARDGGRGQHERLGRAGGHVALGVQVRGLRGGARREIDDDRHL